MTRLPFDPSKIQRPSPTTPARPARPDARISVSQLAALIESALRDHTPPTLRVVGEIGQFTDRTHWYFQLKDAAAVVSCVMFASAARRAGAATGFTPRAGLQVLATGRVEFYAPQGRTQFMVDKLEPIGAGALDLEFKRLCDELRALGYFDHDRKRPLPLLPRRIAVITSRTGAALQDVIDTARRRCPAVALALIDVRVQGEGAAAQVTTALRRLAARHAALAIDAILVTRGGGSMEDLWAFNDRAIADAILASPIPVVAAIGHETDTTIAELVADLRAATPTQAAMALVPDAAALRRQLTALSARLAAPVHRELRVGNSTLALRRRELLGALRDRLSADTRRVERASARLERHRPAALYAGRQAALRSAQFRLAAALRARLASDDLTHLRRSLDAALAADLDRRAAALASAARGLDLVGPHNVLRRGFTLTLTPAGRAIRSAADLAPGDPIVSRFADGRVASTVTAGAGVGGEAALGAGETGGRHAGTAARAAARPRSTPKARLGQRSTAADPAQMGLFPPRDPGDNVTP